MKANPFLNALTGRGAARALNWSVAVLAVLIVIAVVTKLTGFGADRHTTVQSAAVPESVEDRLQLVARKLVPESCFLSARAFERDYEGNYVVEVTIRAPFKGAADILMKRFYGGIFAAREVTLARVTVMGTLEDTYGHRHEVKAYVTCVEREEAERVNWNNLRSDQTSDFLTVQTLQPAFTE